MENYRCYLRHLNRRMLAVVLVLFVFWFEKLYFSFIPEATGLLQHMSSRITGLLAFLAWPALFMTITQLLLNRFLFFSHNGEVRQLTFTYEIKGFFKRTYLYTAFMFLLIGCAVNVYWLASLGMAGWEQKISSPLYIYIPMILTNVFTLTINFEQMTLGTSILAGLYVMLLYFAHSLAIFEPLGDRDNRTAPGAQRSAFAEPHNLWIRMLRGKQGFSSTFFYVLPFLVLLGLVISTQYIHASANFEAFYGTALMLLLYPIAFVIIKLVWSYVVYGWNKVFNVSDDRPVARSRYYSAAEWQASNAFTEEWQENIETVAVAPRVKPKATGLSHTLSKFGSVSSILFALVVESLMFVGVLSIAGLIMFNFNAQFVALIFSFDLIKLVEVIYVNSGLFWKVVLGSYLGWRSLIRIGRFKFGLFDVLGKTILNND